MTYIDRLFGVTSIGKSDDIIGSGDDVWICLCTGAGKWEVRLRCEPREGSSEERKS
ncbi:MAG: hypothetical protein K2M59_06400 [Muribaculaceae bacterium]|nr:hypothetical protein [Muribaculaceae bacterium]